MAKYKVVVTDECIGCRACVTECEETFGFDEEKNVATVKKEFINDKELEKNKEAEEICPVECIKIEKIN